MKSFMVQTVEHEETNYSLDIVARSLEDITLYTPLLTQADKVVGAQFYYTNPLVYMLVKKLDEAACARLYGDYYLVNTQLEHDHDFISNVAAVNSVFLEKIGSYRDVCDELFDNFEDFYNKYGLYLIGIDISDSDSV